MAKLKDTRVYGNLTIDDVLLVSQDATVTGNLTVLGTTTTVNSTTVTVEGPIVQQGAGANGAALTSNDGKDRGLDLSYYSGSYKQAFMGWNTSNTEFRLASDATIVGDVVTFNTYGNVRANVYFGDGGGLSNIVGSNVTGNVALSNNSNYAGNVTGAAQSNITSLGTQTSLTVSGDSNIANLNANGVVNITNTTSSTSDTTGALQVAGGAGVVGNLWVGGTIYGNISGSTKAPGLNTDVVFNDSNTSNATGGFTFNKTTNTVTIGSNITLSGDDGVANIGGNINLGGSSLVDNNSIGIELNSGNVARLNYADNAYATVNSAGVSLTAGHTSPGSGYHANLYTGNGQFAVSNTFSAAGGNLTVDQDGNVNAAGYGSFANVYDTGLSNTQIVFPDATGKLGGSAGLTYASNTLSANNFATTNANIQGNITTSNKSGNLLVANASTGNIEDSNVSMSGGTLAVTNANVTGNLKTANLQVTSFTTTGGIPVADVNGNLSTSSGLTYGSNTLSANNITTGGIANVANLVVTSLTNNEIPFANATSGISGDASFTYTAGTGTFNAPNITANSNITTSTGTISGANIVDTSLSGTEVVFAGTGGTLKGDASFTFASDTLTANMMNAVVSLSSANIYDTDLSANSIVFAGISGLLSQDSANTFAYYTSNATLTAQNVSATTNVTAANVLAGNIGNSTSQLYGNGINISNIAGANVSGYVANANVANTAVYVTGNAQSNITSVGTLTSLTVSGTGSITGANSVSANYFTGTLTTASQPNITSVGTLTSLAVTGNANVSGLLTDNLYYANGTAWDFAKANGSATDIQFKSSAGDLQGSANLTFDDTTQTFTVSGAGIANVTTLNATTGNITTVNSTNLNATGDIISSAGNVHANVNVVADGNITAGNTVHTLDLVATGNANVGGYLKAGDTTIAGNLVVTGTTTSVNTTVSQLSDPLIDLGNGANGAALTSDDGKDRGLLMHTYHSGTVDLFMGWKDSESEFVLAKNVTVSDNVVNYGANDSAKQANLADLRLGNIYAYNANFGGVVFSNGNVTLGTGAYLNGDVNGNISGNIKVKGPNGALQFTANYSSVSGHGDLTTDANLEYIGGNLTVAYNNGGYVITDHVIGTIETAAQPNITSVGTLTSLSIDGGNLSIANNSTSNNGIKTDYIYHTDGTAWDFAKANGASGEIQFSNGTDLTSNSSFTFDNSNGNLAVPGNIITGTGSGGNITGANEIHAQYFYGDGSNLTNVTAVSVPAANLTGSTLSSNVTASSLTSVGILTSLEVTNDITSDSGNLIATNGDVWANAGTVKGLYLEGTLTAASNNQSNITTVGTLGNLSVSGSANVGNIASNGVASTQVVYGTTGNVLTGSAGFTFDVTSNTLSTGNVAVSTMANVGNLTITGSGTVTGNIIPSANATYNLGNSTNAFKDLWLSGTSIHLGSQTISSNSTAVTTTADIAAGNIIDTALSTNQIVFTGAGNLLSGDSTFTYDGTVLDVGNATVATSLVAGNVTSNALTATYVTFAGTNGILTNDSTFTFASGLLSVGNVTTTGNVKAANIIDTALNTNQVPYTTTGNVLSGSTSLTYDGTTFKAGNANVSGSVVAGNVTSNGLTSTQVVYAGTNGLLSSDSGFKYYTSNTTMVANNFVASSTANLGNIANLTITGGTDGQYLVANGTSGALKWASVDAAMISNGTSNVNIATADGDVTISVAGTANVVDISSLGMTVTGVITATGNITGNNITSNNFLTVSGTTDATSAITGAITTAGGISAQGNIYTGHAIGFANTPGSNTSSAAYIQFNATSGSLDFIFN